MKAKLAGLVALVVVMGALAGCAEKAPAAKGEPLQPGSTGGAAPLDGTKGSTTTAPPPPRGTSQRWHFHDHWNGHPTITLAEANVTLNLSARDDGTPMYGHLLALPRGVIVPPETGSLTITVNWSTPEPGPVNLSYRPADSNDFVPFANVAKGEPVVLQTTESMCDVPHRQESRWLFNLSAVAAVDPTNVTASAPQLPPRELSVKIEATIGRPLFIDPPHLDWWMGGSIIPIVTDAGGEIVAATTPAERNVSVNVGQLGQTSPPPAVLRLAQDNVTVKVDEGRIVPEGTRSVVVLLNWTTDVPGAKLALRYAEGNYPSAGPIEVAQDGDASRIFVLPVTNGMTDTTYSNRTTWAFNVLPEGSSSAFQGTFTLFAWATKAEPAEAVRLALGGV